MSIKKDFGARVKEFRTKKRITQFELAEIVGVDPKHISHIERGLSFPKADLIEKLAEALNIHYLEFFRIEYLDNRQDMVKKLSKIIEKSSDDDLRIIFKLVSGIIN